MKVIAPVLVLIISVTSVSCCKTDELAVQNNSIKLLTRASWKQIDSERIKNGNPSSDWHTYEACRNDNITTYKSDKTYEETEGVTKCNAQDTDIIESGTWSISSDRQTLTKDGTDFRLVTLEYNKLVLIKQESGYDLRSTFIH